MFFVGPITMSAFFKSMVFVYFTFYRIFQYGLDYCLVNNIRNKYSNISLAGKLGEVFLIYISSICKYCMNSKIKY